MSGLTQTVTQEPYLWYMIILDVDDDRVEDDSSVEEFASAETLGRVQSHSVLNAMWPTAQVKPGMTPDWHAETK